MTEKNYYEVLGVEPRAPAPVIEQAYWRLARTLHKQTNDSRVAGRLLAINEAYELLGDARRRAAYNREMGILAQEEGAPKRRGWLRRLVPW